MKRMLAVLGCFMAVGILGGIAMSYWYPQSVAAVQMREQQLKWIRTRVPAVRDSVYIIRGTGLQASAQQIDTTAWIPLWDDMQVNPGQNTEAVADTFPCVIAIISESAIATAAGVTVAADTIQAITQVSMNGADAVAVTSTMGLTASQLETSSNNSVYRIVTIGRTWAAGGTAPTNLQLLPYRHIRFIVTGDHAGVYSAYWKYPGSDRYHPAGSRDDPPD